MFRSLVLVFTLCLSWALKAQEAVLSPRASQQLVHVLENKAVEQEGLSAVERSYLSAYRSFLDFVLTERPECVVVFEEQLKDFEAQMVTENHSLLYCQLQLQKGLLLLMTDSPVQGALAFYRANSGFNKLDESVCDPLMHKKIGALLAIFSAQIPENYSFFADMAGFQGDEIRGFTELEAYCAKVNEVEGLNEEGRLLRLFCLLKFGADNQVPARELTKVAYETKVPLVKFLAQMILIKWHQGEEACLIIQYSGNEDYRRCGFLHYSAGRSLLNQLDGKSLNHFRSFIAHPTIQSFKADASLRMAWYYALKDDSASCSGTIKKIADLPLRTSNDRQALAESGEVLDRPVLLLKARLLYDGGSYKEAFDLLSKEGKQIVSDYHRIEYDYRMGNVCYSLKKYEQSQRFFTQVVDASADDTRYFGPYAAIKLAELSLQIEKDKMQAKSWLNAAARLNNGEYRQDIKRKIIGVEKLLK